MLAQPPAQPPARNAVTVTVAAPAAYHRGQGFTVTLTATLKRPRRHPYLLAFIQYSARACQGDPNKELQRTLGTGGAYYHHEFSKSPFSATGSFVAGAPGSRRVCAYLFGSPVTPGKKAKPIATGTAVYTVIA